MLIISNGSLETVGNHDERPQALPCAARAIRQRVTNYAGFKIITRPFFSGNPSERASWDVSRDGD
jgi:hypothetical protein